MMANRRATPYVWLMAVAVFAIVVAENGRLCMADENNNEDKSTQNHNADTDKGFMTEMHDKAESWTEWAKNKISGKWSVDESGGEGHDVERAFDPASLMASRGSGSSEDVDDAYDGGSQRDIGPSYSSMGVSGEPGFRSTNTEHDAHGQD